MKKILITTLLFFSLALVANIILLCPGIGKAATDSNIGVGVVVTNCGNGTTDSGEDCDDGIGGNGTCGDSKTCSASCTRNVCGGGPTDTTGPSITISSSSISVNSAYFKWLLSDPAGIGGTSFDYGISGYVSSTTPVELGGGLFEVNIVGLSSNTTYQYRISATDGLYNLNTRADSFTTIVVPDTPPTISEVTSVVSFTTATLSWIATDDHTIASVSFVYGTTTNYGLTGSVVGNYSTSLSGLSMETTYYFKVTVTDNIGQSSTKTGSFTTEFVDLVGPVISNVSTSVGVSVVTVTFDTNELANGQVLYGLQNDHEGTASGEAAAISHSIILSNLTPNRTYLFKIIATDLAHNDTEKTGLSFKTLPDLTPPPNVTGFQLTTTTNSIILNWTNPRLLDVSDFNYVKILRSINSQVTGPNDPSANMTHITSGETLTDSDVLPNINYYYTIFSFDTSLNYSSGVYRFGKVVTTTHEVCGNGVDDDGNGLVDCADSVCRSLPACIVPVEICNNGIDDDRDGRIDCSDPDCTAECNITTTEICNNGIDDDGNGLVDLADPACGGHGGGEICNNGIDDDSDGKIDCLDPDCVAFINCQSKQCSNGLDDDSDGKIDYPVDPGCVDANDNDEYNPPSSTIPDFAKIDFGKLLFFTGNRKITLTPQNRTVFNLAGSGFTFGVPLNALVNPPASLVFKVNGQSYQFSFSSSSEIYYSDIIFPGVGEHDAYLEINYGNDQFDVLQFYLNGLPKGEITGDGVNLDGAEVSLMQSNGALLYLGVYGEQNPVFTDVNGMYGWVVENGDYYLQIKKDGFFERVTPVFSVKNNVVNTNFNLIKQPKKLLDVIDPNASIGKNAVSVAKNLLEQTGALSQVSVQIINDVADNPLVEQAATQVAAPAAVGVAAVGVAASWLDLVALLRFLFLQPLLLLGKRKREKWGGVYNSLTKLPIDLALVRLFNAETNKLMQTRVTDGQGRYAFIVDRGKYRLEAQKANLVFPSVLLKGFKNDGSKLDIYHGEVIEVTEKNSLITANIPLDPVGVTKTPGRIIREKIWRRLQSGLSWLGFLVTVVSLYISPVWYMWALLVVHLFFLFVFKRITKPKRAKGWGIVYDENSREPVSKVVARLFDSQFNKLVATEITDRQGRYHFLAGGNQYYVTYEHKDYEPTKIEIAGTGKKDEGAITMDVKIKKKSS